MNRVFGIETEYGITVDGVDNVDVVSESIELVRRYTEHGTLMKWDYSLEDPHQDARGVPRRRTFAGHGRVVLLRDRQEPAAELRGDQERPRFEQRGAFLQRSRAPRVFDPRMHTPARAGGAGQGGRAHPGGVRAPPQQEAAAGARGAALQEQHGLRRAQLRLPRQFPDEPPRALGPGRQRHPALSSSRARSSPGPARWAWRRRASPARRACTRFRNGRISSA